jgi:hypothetical protein
MKTMNVFQMEEAAPEWLSNTIAAVVRAGGDDESLYNFLMSRIKQRRATNHRDNLTPLFVRLHTSFNPDPETRLAEALEWCRESKGQNGKVQQVVSIIRSLWEDIDDNWLFLGQTFAERVEAWISWALEEIEGDILSHPYVEGDNDETTIPTEPENNSAERTTDEMAGKEV